MQQQRPSSNNKTQNKLWGYFVQDEGMWPIFYNCKWRTTFKSWVTVYCTPVTYMYYSQFGRSVMSDSLRPHESHHTRPPCPSPTPGVYSNSCPSRWWCHPAISSSVVPFSSCPQSLPASGSFPMSQLFTWGGQSIGVSVSASVLPMNTQDWSPLRWTGWISLQSKGLSRVFSNTTGSKPSIFQRSAFFTVQLSHPYMTRWTFVGNVMSLFFNMLSCLVITFLPKSKHLLNFMAAITICSDFGAPPANKVWRCFHCLPIYFPGSDGMMGPDARICFLNVEL